ncbi:MAG: FAD-dependent oxidoreductase [Firmicutes bacterium]|nr:FAD-dependent oxidoreductase [Bacillota bacterium]
MSAARQGSKVALVERFGIIGGNLTSGHVGPLLGLVGNGTMRDEITKVLEVEQYSTHFDVEKAKINLTNWISHPNIELFLNSPIVDVVMSGNEINGVVIGTQNGMEAIKGKIVIDSTGDGAVSFLAGADVEMGRREDGLVQPVTIMFTVSGIDKEQRIVCTHEEDDTVIPKGNYLDLCRKASETGKLPPTVNIVRLYKTQHADERMVNATQLNHIDGLKHSDLAKSQLELRNQMLQVVEFLRETVPGFENCKIKDSSDIIGVRETRRVVGEYMISSSDLLAGRTFEDVMVHKADFCIDIHNPDGAGQAETEGCPPEVEPYDIPYGCFVPKKIDNLYTAGRCISGSHRAHASYRVMNICMAMGEAIGIAASVCVKDGAKPRALDYKKVQKIMTDSGVELFD